MRYLNIKNNKLVPSFEYDEEVVLAIRGIDGRVWNKPKRQWEIPLENLDEVMSILGPLGFTPSSLVLEKVKEQDDFLQKINAIREGDSRARYVGSLPLFE